MSTTLERRCRGPGRRGIGLGGRPDRAVARRRLHRPHRGGGPGPGQRAAGPTTLLRGVPRPEPRRAGRALAGAARSETFSPVESSLLRRACRRPSAAYFWLPNSVSRMSGERRSSRLSPVSTSASPSSRLTDAWTACRVRPIRRAIWGTVSGRPAPEKRACARKHTVELVGGTGIEPVTPTVAGTLASSLLRLGVA